MSSSKNQAPNPPGAPGPHPPPPHGPRTHVIVLAGGEGGPFVDCSPRALTVYVGDHVRWKNDDHLLMDHSAVGLDGAPNRFDTGAIAPGDLSRPVQFMRPGVYTYRCALHDTTSPVGRIDVLARPTART